MQVSICQSEVPDSSVDAVLERLQTALMAWVTDVEQHLRVCDSSVDIIDSRIDNVLERLQSAEDQLDSQRVSEKGDNAKQPVEHTVTRRSPPDAATWFQLPGLSCLRVPDAMRGQAQAGRG